MFVDSMSPPSTPNSARKTRLSTGSIALFSRVPIECLPPGWIPGSIRCAATRVSPRSSAACASQASVLSHAESGTLLERSLCEPPQLPAQGAPMPWLAILGLALVAVILWDVFETIILPRRVTRRFRLARVFYRWTWRPWRFITCFIRKKNRRESFLSYYGPLSLLGLFVVWAIALIIAFAILHYAAGSAVVSQLAATGRPGFLTDLYMSGTTFFTLGLGDVTPRTELARVITVFEAGLGCGFLAIVISYLPVLYGAFSAREVNISLLDARAGSPPSASEMLRRLAGRGDP